MEWRATWIWGGDVPSPRNAWRCFRKRFTCSKETWTRAHLRITADSRYILYVNGQRVGRGPVRTWAFEQSYDDYDVSKLIHRNEENVISVLVQHFGVSTFAYPYGREGRAGLLVQCDFLAGDHTIECLTSDSTWETVQYMGQDPRSPRLSLQQGFAEIIDARLWPEKWHTDNSIPWASVVEIGPAGTEPWVSLVPRDIPMLTEETTQPKSVLSLKSIQPVVFTCTLDLRNQMDPESIYHANVVRYTGYVATVLRLMTPGQVEIGFPNGSLTINRVLLGGRACVVGDMSGELPKRFWKVQLPAGDHLLMLDVHGYDHGRNPQLAIDADTTFELRSPMFTQESNPFISLGPFDKVRNTNSEPDATGVGVDNDDYIALASCTSSGELLKYGQWIRPFDDAFVSPVSVFSLCVWKKNVVTYPVPLTLQQMVMASPEPAKIPIYSDADTEFVIDFGRELSGYIQFELDAADGTIIDCYGYEYQKDGWRQDTFDLENTFRYICQEGHQTYQSPTRRGLRYLMVTVRNASRAAKIYGIQLVQSNYPVAEVGKFACSDALLNDIFDISRHTTRLCMEDTFVDCPAYEQAFWVGDSRNESLVNYYVFGAHDIVKRCLRLVPKSRYQTPYYTNQVPSGWVSVIPNWTFFWIIACEEYLQRTNEIEFAQEVLPHILYTLDHYCLHLNTQHLLNIDAWNLLDWAPLDQPNSGVVSHQNMFLVQALRATVCIADRLGRLEVKHKYENISRTLAAAIDEYMWCKEKQAYIDSIHADGVRSKTLSMQTQIVAYLCDVASEDRKKRIEQYLLSPPSDFVQIGSPFMSFFYYEALTKMGRADRVMDEIRQDFGTMVMSGATTCWEMYPNFDVNRANKDFLTRSHCHAWSAAPGYFLPRLVLGIEAVQTGWKEVVVRPSPCGVDWARGTVPLPDAGQIDVSWTRSGDTMELHVWAPPSVSVRAELPDGVTGQVSIHTTQ